MKRVVLISSISFASLVVVLLLFGDFEKTEFQQVTGATKWEQRRIGQKLASSGVTFATIVVSEHPLTYGMNPLHYGRTGRFPYYLAFDLTSDDGNAYLLILVQQVPVLVQDIPFPWKRHLYFDAVLCSDGTLIAGGVDNWSLPTYFKR